MPITTTPRPEAPPVPVTTGTPADPEQSRAGAFSFALASAAGALIALDFPHLDVRIRLVAGTLGIAVAGLISRRPFDGRDAGWFCSCLAASAIATRVPGIAGAVVVSAALLACTWWLPRAALLRFPIAAAGITALVGTLLDGPTYHLAAETAAVLNRWIRMLGATGTYGQSFLGLAQLGYVGVLAVLTVPARRRWRRDALALAGLAFGWCLVSPWINELVSANGPWIERTARTYVPHLGAGFVFLVPILLSYLTVALWGAWWHRGLGDLASRGLSRPLATAIGLAFGVAVTVAALAAGEAGGPLRIGVYRQGLVNFETPKHGIHGVANTGMFGLWVARLERSGHGIEMVDTIDARSLGSLDALVLTNPNALAEGAVGAMERFVAGGGLLVVLGDHTNIEGTQDIINQALQPYGAWLRFDSATPVGSNYRSMWRFSPVIRAAGVGEDNSMLRFGLGGSFDLDSWQWHPWMVMTHAFSDIGNRANLPSLLGDKQYSHGELLGDLPVAAARRYGQGRVVIFGDTSSFQNLAVLRTEPLITDAIFRRDLAWPVATLVAGLGCTLMAAVLLATGRPAFSIGGLLAAAAVVGTAFASGGSMAAEGPSAAGERKLLVDIAKAGSISLQTFRRTSIDGLLMSGVRSGFWPQHAASWASLDDAIAADVFVTISPQRPISDRDVAALQRFLERGGTAILAAGYGPARTIRKLEERFGFTITDSILGPVPIREKLDPGAFLATRAELQMKEAWMLALHEPSDWEQTRSVDNYLVMAVKRVGEGRLLVISDGRFLLDENLEGEKEGWDGNIAVVRKFLEEGRLQ